MSTPAVDRKTRRLLTQLAVLEGVLNGSLATVCVDQLKRSLFAEAASLREEMAKPMTEVIAPYAPYSGIVRTGPDTSVGTTEGREL